MNEKPNKVDYVILLFALFFTFVTAFQVSTLPLWENIFVLFGIFGLGVITGANFVLKKCRFQELWLRFIVLKEKLWR